jgi:cell division septum initiation protein DivIVA
MATDIRLLEDLVNKAVDRLKRLSEERHELQQEVDALRQQLDALEKARESAGGGSAGWEAQRAHVTAELRETLDELRGE